MFDLFETLGNCISAGLEHNNDDYTIPYDREFDDFINDEELQTIMP